MFPFAQTNLQLYSQLRAMEYTGEEVAQVRAAHDAIVPFFAAQYRGTGKPFIAHLIGTASILASRAAPLEEVIAGLLHAIYSAGDFGFQRGAQYTTRKEKWVTDTVGKDVATLICAFHQLPWHNGAAIRQHLERWPGMAHTERSAIKIRLANLLDDLSDAGMQQNLSDKNRRYLSAALQQSILDIAEKSAWPDARFRLEREFEAINECADSLEPASDSGFTRLRLPPSATLRALPRAQRMLLLGRRALRRRSST